MKYAVFADIHGNLEALSAAIEYSEVHELSHFLVLGDTVGYGANPNECLEWSFKNAELHILGNHEAAVTQEKIRWGLVDWARTAIDWTTERLLPGLIAQIGHLPYLQTRGNLTLAHGTLHNPEHFDYLMDPEEAHQSFMASQTTYGFIGHTHVPCFFVAKGPFGHLKPGVLKLKRGERYLLNPGSIGQPRDRDPRLSFGVFDPKELTFEIVRLPYDNKKAAQKIISEGLPKFLADRLL